jgi:uncharacterized membrane protein YuzA (DUF378 family)
MKKLHVLSFILVIVGALNWGLVGFFNFNLVATIFGDMSAVSRIIYALVGISAVVELAGHKRGCKACGSGCKTCGTGEENHSMDSESSEM